MPAGATLQPRHRAYIAGRFNGPWNENDRWRRAVRLSEGRGIPRNLWNNAGSVMGIIEQAEALDVPLGAALQNLYLVSDGPNAGTIGMRASFMVGLAMRAGYRIVQLHLDEIKCVLRLQRPDGTLTPQVSWHKLRAQRAGLFGKADGKNPWVLYTEDMLWARAVSQLLRRWASHVTGGLHTDDELNMDALGDLVQLDDTDASFEGTEPMAISPAVQDYLTDQMGGGDYSTLQGIREALHLQTSDVLRSMMEQVRQVGLENTYAGTQHGIHHMLSELVYEAGLAALQREAAAGTLTGGGIPHEERQHLDEVHQADAADAAEAALPVGQQPAGQGRLHCDCDAYQVVMTGEHGPKCTLASNTRTRKGGR